MKYSNFIEKYNTYKYNGLYMETTCDSASKFVMVPMLKDSGEMVAMLKMYRDPEWESSDIIQMFTNGSVEIEDIAITEGFRDYPEFDEIDELDDGEGNDDDDSNNEVGEE